MSKFKDTLYDKNDIIVAVVILIVAAIIIYFRINAIMDYPETVVIASDESTQTTETKNDNSGNTSNSTDSENADAADTDSDSKSDKEEASDTKKATTVKIVITDGDSSYSVSEKLKDKGLVDSATAFNKIIKKYNMESYLQTGTFTIPTDATNKEILELITNRDI